MSSKNRTLLLVKRITAEVAAGKPWIEVSEGDIRSLKKYANDGERLKRDHDIPDEVNDACKQRFLRIGAAQSAKGLAYLKGIIWTPRGELSKSKQAAVFDQRHREVIENFSHFELRGVVDMNEAPHGRAYYVPLYRVVAKGGERFDYIAGSWQSGVGIEIWRHD